MNRMSDSSSSEIPNSSDAISRQAAIDALVNKLDSIDHVPQWAFDELTGVISELPSVQQEPEHTMEEFMYGQDLGSPEDGSL